MAQHRQQRASRAAARGKYAPLYRHLAALARPDWEVSFAEIETILGFALPASARLHRSWWANRTRSGGHSHALAWKAAGWKTTQVNLATATLVFKREDGTGIQTGQASPVHGFNLARDFPAVDMGPWPRDFKVSREEIYDDLGPLAGGPEGSPDDGQ